MATTVTAYKFSNGAAAANTYYEITHNLNNSNPMVNVWCDTADSVNYKQDITASTRIKVISASKISVETNVPVKVIVNVIALAIA